MSSRKIRTDWATWIIRAAHAAAGSWTGTLAADGHTVAWITTGTFIALLGHTFWPVRKDRL